MLAFAAFFIKNYIIWKAGRGNRLARPVGTLEMLMKWKENSALGNSTRTKANAAVFA